MGKSSEDVNFTLCYDDTNKDEIERLHHMISEMESENGCNRLLITRLEDELLMIRKSETRAVSRHYDEQFPFVDICVIQEQDRDLKSDKLRVLRYKVKTIGSKALEKTCEDAEKPKLHHNEIAVLEDDLKTELDILNSLAKAVSKTKETLSQKISENREMLEAIEKLKTDLSGE